MNNETSIWIWLILGFTCFLVWIYGVFLLLKKIKIPISGTFFYPFFVGVAMTSYYYHYEDIYSKINFSFFFIYVAYIIVLLIIHGISLLIILWMFPLQSQDEDV